MTRTLTVFFSLQTLVFGLVTLLTVTASAATLLSVEALAGESIKTFTPQGKVKPIRQVRVEFSAPMVKFGEKISESQPFVIACPAPGKGRWADTKNWVYDFDRDLEAGIQCKFTLQDGTQTLEKKSIEGKKEFLFSSGEPAVESILPRPSEWSPIQEDQAFLLLFDGTINAQDDLPPVLKKAYFSISGVQEKIPFRLVTGQERKEIIAAQEYYWDFREPSNDSRIAVVQAKRKFPFGAEVSLVVNEETAKKGAAEGNQLQKYDFKVIPEFKATVSCRRLAPESPCVPLDEIRVVFSSEVPVELIKKIVLRNPQGKAIAPFFEENSDSKTSKTAVFKGPFLEKTKYRIELPVLEDESGRPLVNAKEFPIEVETDQYPPLAKFSSSFGILEWNAAKGEAILPVTIRRVEADRKIRGRMLRLHSSMTGPTDIEAFSKWTAKVDAQSYGDGRARSVFSTGVEGATLGEPFEFPKLEESDQTEVVGIPIKRPGVYVVEIESHLLGKKLLGSEKSMFVSTVAVVTDTAVHFKKGVETSLVWVTSLQDGKVKPNALVTIQNCSGKVISQVRTGADGVGRFKQLPDETPSCTSDGYSPFNHGFFAAVNKDDDFSFAHSSWDKGIEPWRFNLNTYASKSNQIPHTVMDRTLLKQGDTLHLKAFFRKHIEPGISLVPQEELPKQISIQGPDQSYDGEVKWEANGTAEYSWTVPKAAKLGHYEVYLKKGKENLSYSDRHFAGSFVVEDFRIPLMKGSIKPVLKPVLRGAEDEAVSEAAPESVKIDLNVSYFSGGGAAKIPVSFRYLQRPKYHHAFSKYEGYSFSTEPVKAGLQGTQNEVESNQYEKQVITLDASGGARVQVGNLKKLSQMSDLEMELEFKDPNGEIQTTGASLPLFPADRILGVKSLDSSWRGKGKVEFLVVNSRGVPQSGVDVTAKIFKQNWLTHRKKVVGGFYAYEHKNEIEDQGQVCSGKTDETGKLVCQAELKTSGSFILEGQITDSKGRPNFAKDTFYSYGAGTYFSQEDDDRIDVLPEKKSYEAGEKAVFQVRSPFRKATALVSVEREGVLDAFVVPLSDENPTIEVPIKKNYAPNVYVSALVVRGRVADPQPTAMVDLAKPAFKFGIGKIKVGWKAHELKVSVTPDQAIYRVRQNARVKIKVANSLGAAPKKGEVLFAAVDEALLMLKDNSSWDLLGAMMGERPYQVTTYTSQMQVVGKRHFGMKAMLTGGGGSAEKAFSREAFDPLLLWVGKAALNAKGEAVVTVPLNDSVSSFKLVAVAYAGADQFGTGSASIRTIQELSILSGIPPLVREGDRFPAEFTVRNTSAETMDLEVRGKYQIDKNSFPLASQRLQLTPGQAEVVKWELEVPYSAQGITYEVEAKELESPAGFRSLASDRVIIKQKVVPAIPVRVYQATLEQLDKTLDVPVKAPEGAIPGRGGVNVTLQPKISDGLSGVSEYMGRYPYSCLEQKVSKIISLKEKSKWAELMEQLPAYLDSEGLAKFFPTDLLRGSDTLTSYILSAASQAGLVIPESSREKMLGGLKRFVQGSMSRAYGSSSSNGAGQDLTLRKLDAMEALSRYGQMQPDLLSTIEITPSVWPTSGLLAWLSILQKNMSLPSRADRIEEVRQNILSRLNFQGTRLKFSTESSDRMAGLFSTSEINLNRLILLLSEGSGEKKSSKEDLARLVRASLAQQSEGHWSTTPGNVWGVLAFDEFSKAFETEPVSGETSVTLGEVKNKASWNPTAPGATPRMGAQSFNMSWPSNAHDSQTLSLVHQGTGKPWITLQSKAALPLKAPVSSGFKIQKKLIPVEVKKSGEYHKGDIYRVQLDLEAQSDENWVVIEDPIPAGSMILGSGLGNDSRMMVSDEKREGLWPTFEERSFEAFRAYYESIYKGKWSIQYTIRLNQSGAMNLPATRVEAMYSPENMGENPNATFKIVD